LTWSKCHCGSFSGIGFQTTSSLKTHLPSTTAAVLRSLPPRSNPIRQPLANLEEAGQLYGAIIYQKAPIVMRQLELAVGERAFRDGVREYLKTYSYRNATWLDLIRILDARTPNYDRLIATCPQGLIDASETFVGLPKGQMGNSEVGHMYLGAGRVAVPELPRIDKAVETGALAKNPLNRYQSAQEMRADALRAVAGRPVLATPVMSEAETMAMAGPPMRQQTAMTRAIPANGGPYGPRPPERDSRVINLNRSGKNNAENTNHDVAQPGNSAREANDNGSRSTQRYVPRPPSERRPAMNAEGTPAPNSTKQDAGNNRVPDSMGRPVPRPTSDNYKATAPEDRRSPVFDRKPEVNNDQRKSVEAEVSAPRNVPRPPEGSQVRNSDTSNGNSNRPTSDTIERRSAPDVNQRRNAPDVSERRSAPDTSERRAVPQPSAEKRSAPETRSEPAARGR